MILEGNERGGAKNLALHLMKEENDHVTVHEIRGFMSDELLPALNEIYAISRGTKARKFMFSLSLNPPLDVDVSTEDFMRAIERAENDLGLTGQPRAIVFHEKNARRHCHVVWSRIDALKMKAIKIDYYKLKLMDISRDLYLEHGWEMPRGFIKSYERNPSNYTLAQWQQAKRSGKHSGDIKAAFQDCWAASDNLAAFKNALMERGYMLAIGRRGYVAVDKHCEIYSVARQLPKGTNTKQLNERLGEPKDLPSVEEAKKQMASVMAQRLDTLGQEQKSTIDARRIELENTRSELVHAQKTEREALEAQQAELKHKETKQRQARFRRYLSGLWDRLTGRHASIQAQNKQEAKETLKQDQSQFDQLIFKHLNQRWTLQRRIERLDTFSQTNSDKLKRDIEQFNEISQGTRDAFDAIEERLSSGEKQRPIRAMKPDPDQPLIIAKDLEAESLPELIRRSPVLILDVLSDKNESFTRNEIVKNLAKYIEVPEKLRVGIEQVFASKELVQLQEQPEALYSTRSIQAVKASVLRHADLMDRNEDHGTSNHDKNWAINKHNALLRQRVGASLSAEQRSAIKHLLGKEQLSVAVGLAGTGKSTLLAAVNDAWKKQERRVFGASVSGKAVDGLQDASGIESRTLAAWELSWKNKHNMLKPGDVFVIDEAGMVGSRQMDRFMDYVQKSGAKLVLVGDPEQLQPIQAGTPLRDIGEKIGHAKLQNILRQKENWQRQASLDLAQNRTEKAIDAYEKNGAVYKAGNLDTAISRLVEDYVRDIETNGDKTSCLGLAYRRRDVHLINQGIRNAKLSKGLLADEQLFNTDHGPRKFGSNDRIVFTKNDKDMGVRNGLLGTVTKVNYNELTIELDNDGASKPRKLTIKPHDYSALDHGYATTIHKSQGITVDRSFVLAGQNVDRHLTYVAMSRHKSTAKLYIDNSAVQLRHFSHRGREMDMER